MRTLEELRQHYEAERDLADRLRNAPQAERARLYGIVYDELFQRVPHHPQLTRISDAAAQEAAVTERMALLRRFLRPDTVFLEIGSGDCSLTRRVASLVAKCYALDVSQEILSKASADNIELVVSDGRSVPVPSASITVAYSYQVMEHVHPDDALEQLGNIYAALAPHGIYICVTPNRLNGPHDVSKYFDDVARGFHLREYTVTELCALFRSVGFRRIHCYVGIGGRYFRLPPSVLTMLEAALSSLPHRLRRQVGSLRGVQNFLFISIAAVK